MVKLNSLIKQVKELTRGTSLAGYMQNQFTKTAQRELLLLYHLPTVAREKVLLLAQENCSIHSSVNPEELDEISDLAISRVIQHKPGWLWRNFGFFFKTISDLIDPEYCWSHCANDSELWSKFWEAHDLKLDLFREEFSIDQDSINTESAASIEDFFLPGNWSSGIDKDTRNFIIGFSDWGEVTNYFDTICSNSERKNRWALVERVKKQFLQKKFDFSAGELITIPVKGADSLKQDDSIREPNESQLTLINTLCNRMKKKHRNACITFLTEFQRIRHLVDEKNTTATKVRTVQDRMKSRTDLPTPRTLEDWIKTYEMISRR